MDKKEKLKYLAGIPLLLIIGFITVTKGAFPKTDIEKHFRYDESRIVSQEKSDVVNNIYSVVYSDSENRIVKEIVYSADDDKATREIKYSYSPNGSYIQMINRSPGRVTPNVVFNCFDKNRILKEYYLCTYYGPGNCVTNIYGTNSFNKDGILKSTTEYKVYMRRLEETFKTEYTLDNLNRITEKTVYTNRKITLKNIYEYDLDIKCMPLKISEEGAVIASPVIRSTFTCKTYTDGKADNYYTEYLDENGDVIRRNNFSGTGRWLTCDAYTAYVSPEDIK